MAKTLIGTRIAAIYELQAEWMEPKLTELGISWATFQLLTTVANAGDGASQIEVARRLGLLQPDDEGAVLDFDTHRKKRGR